MKKFSSVPATKLRVHSGRDAGLAQDEAVGAALGEAISGNRLLSR